MKKFLSVFCAIAMMATLVVPSYAADYSMSAADVTVAGGNGVQTVDVVLNANSGGEALIGVEAIMTHDAALKLVAVSTEGAVADAGFDVTPGGNLGAAKFKVIADTMDAVAVNGVFVTYTFEVDTDVAGEYNVNFQDLYMMAEFDDLMPDDFTAKIIVEEVAVEEPEVVDGEVSADFGANYAYIRENKYDGATKYELCLISALKNISGFAGVGFEVKVAGKDAVAGDLQTMAYKKFTFGEEDVDVAMLGDGFEYMVYDSFEFDAADADTAVYFRVFGETAEGTVYGAWKSIDSLAK